MSSRLDSAVVEAPDSTTTAGEGNGTAATATDVKGKKKDTQSLRGRHIVRIEVKGATPLLMHAMSEDDVINVLIRKKQKQIKTDASLEEMAAERLYKDSKGTIGIPNVNLFATVRAAGRNVKLSGKQTVSTATSSTLSSFFQIVEEFLELTNQTWRPDVRKGNMKNKGQSTAVGIVRPRFDEWGFTAHLIVDFDRVNLDLIKELLAKAGTLCGLCSFRPNCNGTFGKFTVTAIEVEGPATV